MTNLQTYLKSLPSSSYNNDRAIMRSKLAYFSTHPSEVRALEIENISQGELEADFLDRDLGNDPKEGHEPHYQLDNLHYDEI